MGAAYPAPVRITGAVVTAAGAAALMAAFAQFAIQGRGPPAPPAPPGQLVVRRLYRYVRNPVYLAVLAVITGQALLLNHPVQLGYYDCLASLFTHDGTVRIPHINAKAAGREELRAGIE